jgi:hypothetical protein
LKMSESELRVENIEGRVVRCPATVVTLTD